MEFGKKTLLVLRFFHHKVLVRGYVGRKGQDALMPNAWPLCRFLKEIDHIKAQSSASGAMLRQLLTLLSISINEMSSRAALYGEIAFRYRIDS